MLFCPQPRTSSSEDNVATTVAEFGNVVTADGATPHTMGAYTTLVAATASTSYGVMIMLGAVGTAASTNTRTLVDIAIGGAGVEQVIIPSLIAGQAQGSASANGCPNTYWFPIRIAQGTRVSARAQSLALSETVNVQIRLMQGESPGRWYGSRVTAYGAATADSTGTSHTNANGSYATTTQLTASTSRPIRAMQVGIDLLTDTTGTTARGLLRIAAGSSTSYVARDLQFRESTTLESMDFMPANFALSQMYFSLPSGIYIGVGADMNKTGEARGFIVYGVD